MLIPSPSPGRGLKVGKHRFYYGKSKVSGKAGVAAQRGARQPRGGKRSIYHCKYCCFVKMSKNSLHIHSKWEVEGLRFIVKTDVKKTKAKNSLIFTDQNWWTDSVPLRRFKL